LVFTNAIIIIITTIIIIIVAVLGTFAHTTPTTKCSRSSTCSSFILVLALGIYTIEGKNIIIIIIIIIIHKNNNTQDDSSLWDL